MDLFLIVPYTICHIQNEKTADAQRVGKGGGGAGRERGREGGTIFSVLVYMIL